MRKHSKLRMKMMIMKSFISATYCYKAVMDLVIRGKSTHSSHVLTPLTLLLRSILIAILFLNQCRCSTFKSKLQIHLSCNSSSMYKRTVVHRCSHSHLSSCCVVFLLRNRRRVFQVALLPDQASRASLASKSASIFATSVFENDCPAGRLFICEVRICRRLRRSSFLALGSGRLSS